MRVTYDDGTERIFTGESMQELAKRAVELAKNPDVKRIMIQRTGNPKKDPNQRRKARRGRSNELSNG